MELGQFIAKVISDVKENVKGVDGNDEGHVAVELDLNIHISQGGKISVVGSHSSENVSRLKIPLDIKW